MSSFHVLSLPCIYYLLLLQALLSNLQTIAIHPHSKVFDTDTPTFVPQKHLMTLYGLIFCRIEIRRRCFDKKWYDRFSIYLIACNIPSVFPVTAWHSIRKHNLVYINHKYVIYLPLLVKVFRCNLHLTKFETRHLYYTFWRPSYDFLLSRYIRQPMQLSDNHQAA